jgi:hypothetical protein
MSLRAAVSLQADYTKARSGLCGGLIRFGGRWLLYYGTADSLIGVAAGPAAAEIKQSDEV